MLADADVRKLAALGVVVHRGARDPEQRARLGGAQQRLAEERLRLPPLVRGAGCGLVAAGERGVRVGGSDRANVVWLAGAPVAPEELVERGVLRVRSSARHTDNRLPYQAN